MTAVPNIFANQTGPIPLAQLDANFAAFQGSAGASMLYDTMSYTGAVARTQHDKNSDHISIKDFGALGDDSTDNSAFITSAMTAAGITGGVVYIPRGTYRFGTMLTVPAGVSLVGEGDGSILKYTGSANAISTADVFPLDSGHMFSRFKLTTTTSSPSLGPGVNGIVLNNNVRVLVDCHVRGFSGSGVAMASTTGKANINITFGPGANIHENDIGVLATGVASATNAIDFVGSRIRANVSYNIKALVGVLGWSFIGGVYEAGGINAFKMDNVRGLAIHGAYFEQTAATTCLELGIGGTVLGLSIHGCVLQGNGSGQAISLGNAANFVEGVDISGNWLYAWTNGIVATSVKSARLGPNFIDPTVTTPYTAPGSTCTGVEIHTGTDVQRYAMPLSELTWNGSAWSGFSAEMTGANYTVLAADVNLIANRAGAVTITLPAASASLGRRIRFRTIQAQTIDSNSSDVVPRIGGSAGTAIVPNTDGAWADIVSDGTNWQIVSSS